ncbi:MAG: hypothetical protein SVQ76_01335, partial [Candidatus Nanohaloarchaea archaeon]|nr:hypothetical protein [Candidatus Nanohaloarchaea archaeon]
QSATDSALSNFREEASWTVHEHRVSVHSPADLDRYPVDFDFPYPRDIDPDSILVTENGSEIPSQHSAASNDTVFVANLSEGVNSFEVVYTSRNVSDRSYISSLDSSGSKVWNDHVNITFNSQGIEDASFEGHPVVTWSDLGASSTPEVDLGTLRANVSYADADVKRFLVYEGSGRVRFREWFSGSEDWDMNLSQGFDEMYASDLGSTRQLDTTGTIYSGTTDWLDVHNSTLGLSLIGDNLDVNVTRSSTSGPVELDVDFSDSGGRKDILLVFHDGNHTESRPDYEEFLDPLEVTVGVSKSLEGVWKERAEELEKLGYDELGELLGIEGLDYNVSVGNFFDAGRRVDTDTTVSVESFPLSVVGRRGNVSAEDMVIRVWP